MVETPLKGPDLALGIDSAELSEGQMLLGHAEGEAVLLAKHGGEIFAVGATCTHYGATLSQGLLVDDTVRCPRHHACFSLRTGEALAAPALDPIPCWIVEKRGARLFVVGKSKKPPVSPAAPPNDRSPIVIVGGG